MARLRSPEKHRAILDAAVAEIAENGLSAATAKIAQRAGIAAGTLFLYFPNKEALFNELYLDLKTEVFQRINTTFPAKASLEKRARHLWLSYLDWAIESPLKRKVSLQLNLSDIVTPATREQTAEERHLIDAVMREIDQHTALRDLPKGFAGATLLAMQQAAIDFIHQKPKERTAIADRAFQIFWRAVR
jgi:AcrR family transcriptional regulator